MIRITYFLLSCCVFLLLSGAMSSVKAETAEGTEATEATEATKATEATVTTQTTEATRASATTEQGIPVSITSASRPAAEPSSTAEVPKAPPWAAEKLGAALALVLGLGLVGVVILRKYKFRNRKATQFQMKILAQHFLGPKRSLAVVSVAGESILIGVTDHHISLIKSLSLLDEELPAVAPAKFESILQGKTEDPFEEGLEQFSLGSIHDVVHRRAKGLRSIE
ncbi:MAG: hypothetical protein C5B49_13310 [Bdellovibrio sp.]|nr:MAG: hypothetical protein C5B49_13310 [Bdellovibrio sp.]